MHPEPKRHHFIPQFILRNFRYDDLHLYYFDKQTGRIISKEPKDIFVEQDLYRDEINNFSDPVKIEKDLGKFEGEVASIIQASFLKEREIFVSKRKMDALKLFLVIMGFRSLNVRDSLGSKISRQSQKFYYRYQLDGNFLDLWKRNLGYIVNCRSFDEVLNHSGIDDPFKAFFQRYFHGYTGKYIVVAEAEGDCEFVIGDTYPVALWGTTSAGLQLDLYEICPISPKRAILFVNQGAMYAPSDILDLRPNILRPPFEITDAESVRIRVKRISGSEVQDINCKIEQNARQGFAFRRLPAEMSMLQNEE